MQLFYRGYAYETSAPISPDAADQSPLKLIYRGHTYYTHPHPEAISRAVEPEAQLVTLAYRGSIYQINRQPLKPYRQPRAMNWRWQF